MKAPPCPLEALQFFLQVEGTFSLREATPDGFIKYSPRIAAIAEDVRQLLGQQTGDEAEPR
jgi:hypothetical protein